MTVQAGQSRLQVLVRGAGEPVVLLPFLGRGVGDFEPLVRALTDAGYQTIAVNPRGVGQSGGPLAGLTLHDYAADVARVIEQHGAPAHVVGYTMGNRIARCLAADRPELVQTLTLLAAGGQVQRAGAEGARQKQLAVFRRFIGLGSAQRRPSLLSPLRRRLLRGFLKTYYFAPASRVPDAWLQDWWPEAAVSQFEAGERTPLAEWQQSGAAPVLVIQGLADRVAPPANGYAVREALGQQRVQVLDLADAGHALLAEQPAPIARALVEFLRAHPRPAQTAAASLAASE